MSVFKEGGLALITGGASGIGLAVAKLCLDHDMLVAIVDISWDNLALAIDEILAEKPQSLINGFVADVSKEEEWLRLKEEVEGCPRFDSKEVDFLMLNAGIGALGTWGDAEYFQKVLSTNLFGVINGLNTFVPAFKSRKSSRPSAIVVTGSKQGITNPPGNAAYNASKAAVKSLTEHLSYDLRDTDTSVHLLVPGWTHTGLTGKAPLGHTAAPKPEGAWHASQVASYMFSNMQANKFYIICPDNDVNEATDKKRMLWSVMDIVKGRPPLSRWRPEFKEEAEKWMSECDVD